MTTFNTGNTVPSTDARDLSDNAENFDSAVNTQSDVWSDRLGVNRDTVTGRLKKMGYTVPVGYGPSLVFTVNDNVKTVDENGVIYAPLPSALPFTTSGTWASDDEDRFFVVQIANLNILDNTFAKYKGTITAGSPIITVPVTFTNAQVSIDGIEQLETSGDYTFDGVAKTITMAAPFTFAGTEDVEVQLNDIFVIVGVNTFAISNTVSDLIASDLDVGDIVETKGFYSLVDGGGAKYIVYAPGSSDGAGAILLDNGNVAIIQAPDTALALQFGVQDNVDATAALLSASQYTKTLSFAGLSDVLLLSSLTVDENCNEWFIGSTNIKSMAGEINFAANGMRLIGKDGRLDGGNNLAKVTVTTGINTNIIEVDDASVFEVGQHLACSLDNGYLPNSANRSGYIEHGDFNRIININGNIITMAYNFLRDDLYTVSTGIIAGAWVGNNKFGANGLNFTGKGSPVIKGVTIGKFPSYTIKVEDGTPDGQLVDPRTTKMTLKDILFEDTTLDIIWFRGLGITCDNVKATQQKDFGKQFMICSTPFKTGYVKFINGCNIARMNRDGEVLPFSFGDQALTECGLVSLDGTNVFSGEHDPDITVAPDGQVQYYGAQVPYSDSILAFHSFDSATGLKWKGFHSRGDRFLKYMWGIFATPSTPPPTLEVDTIIFEGSYSECDPVFIKNPNSTQDRIKNNIAHFIGGEYHTRVNFQVNQGVVTMSNGAKWVCPYETTQIPATPTVTLKDFHMIGGTIEGGWRVNSNTCSFKETILSYANSTIAQPPKSLLLSAPLSTDVDTVNFILEDPSIYEGTALPLKDFDGILDLTRWIGFNQSTLGIGSNIKMRMYGSSAELYTGSESGFSKLYSATFSRPTESSGLFAQVGAWTRARVGDFVKTASSPNSLASERIDTAIETTSSTLETVGATVVTLDATPMGDEDLIGIYDLGLSTWYWYHVTNITGNDVTIGNSSSSTTGLVKDVAIGAPIQLIKLEVATSGGVGFFPSTKIEITSNVTTPFNDPLIIPFDSAAYDELGAFSVGAPTRLTVPAGVSRVDMSAYIQYSTLGVPVDTAFYMRITHFNSANTVLEVVAGTTQRTGYAAHRVSISELGINVATGDYFEVEVAESSVVNTISRARFTMVQAK